MRVRHSDDVRRLALRRPLPLLSTAVLGSVLAIGLVPTSASAFTATPAGAATRVATGDASDDVSVSRSPDGRVIVEVLGQAFDGAAPAGCGWDPDLEQLACAADVQLDIRLGGGDDNLDVGGDVAVTAYGEGGGDALQAGAAGSVLDAGDGDDSLTGGAGADRLSGGTGNDVVDAAGGSDVVDGGDGSDVVDGGSGDDTLSGGAGDDQIDGTSGNDRIDGGDGRDVIAPGTGAGRTSGGAGNDQIALSGAAGGEVSGDDGDDTLDATDAVGPVALDGGAGQDSVLGSPAADRLQGGAGDDVLTGAGAADALAGGDGFDRVAYGDDGAVTVTVGAGADDGRPGEGDDVQGDLEQVDGTSDDDTLVAGPGGTILNGLGGDDHLVGGPGADQLLGGPGLDRLEGGAGTAPDAFLGGPDADQVSYVGRAEPLTIDQSSREPVSGAAGEGDRFLDAVENVVGGTAGDRIVGQPGIAHRIDAGAGDDTVVVRELLTQRSDTAADGVTCGAGSDTVESDRFDVVAVSCERVTVDAFLRRPEMVFGVGAQRVRVGRGGRSASVRVGCDARTRGYCATRVLLRDPGAKKHLARREIRIMPGKTLTVRLQAPKNRASKLRKRSKVLVVVAARDKVGRGSIAKVLMKTKKG